MLQVSVMQYAKNSTNLPGQCLSGREIQSGLIAQGRKTAQLFSNKQGLKTIRVPAGAVKDRLWNN